MRFASEWQRLHVSPTCVGYTGDSGCDLRRMSCTEWQSMHVATFVSPFFRSSPCLLVQYSVTWSTRMLGLKRFMYSAEEWHLPQNSGMPVRFGAPRYGFALKFGSIAAVMSSPSF